MSKVRSPNYPTISLVEALEAIRPAFKAENRNKMSRAVLGKHLGYKSLSGPALSKIGAVRAYGLIDGAGDDLRISDDSVHALVAPKDSSERKAALSRLALRPSLFDTLHKEFQTLPSEENLRYWLIQRQYTEEASAKAVKSYLATMKLVTENGNGYDDGGSGKDGLPPKPAADPPSIAVGDLIQVEIGGALQLEKPKRVRAIKQHEGETYVFIEGEKTGIPVEQAVLHEKGASDPKRTAVPPVLEEDAPKPGQRREVFALDEGDVALTFPDALSVASYEDLEAYLAVFLKKAKRRAAGSARAHRYEPGETVPETGPYRVSHMGHDGAEQLALKLGEKFPSCDQCPRNTVRYSLVS